MTNINACRACLATDTLLYSLSDGNLEEFYHQLTNISLQETDKRPKQLCYECFHKLKRCKQFRDKCIRAEEALEQIVSSLEVDTEAGEELSKQLCFFNNELNTSEASSDADISEMKDEPELFVRNGEVEVKVELEYDCDDSVTFTEHVNSADEELDVPLRNEDEMTLDQFRQRDEEAVDDVSLTTESEHREQTTFKGADVGKPQNNVTGAKTKNFHCKVCKKSYKYEVRLMTHMKCHPEYTYESVGLNKIKQHRNKIRQMKSFKKGTRKSTTNHSNSTKKTNGKKMYECSFCQYKTIDICAIQTHTRSHTGEKPFACNLCSYKTGKKSDLIRHTKIHTEDKPFNCELCSFKTRFNCDLVRHIRIHTGEKPFNCNFCDFKTKDKSSLVVHTRMHTGEKPYKCGLCSYKAITKSHINRHAKLKHNGETCFA